MESHDPDAANLAEKGRMTSSAPSADEALSEESAASLRVPSALKAWNDRVESFAGLESRGIERVPPEERQAASQSADLQVALLWFSANLSLNNLAAGLFGPMVFGLGFLDSALLAVFGTILGACSTAYMATWGPQSGNRTMVSLVCSLIGVLKLSAHMFSAGCPSFLHGLLASQTTYIPQRHSHGWIHRY